MKPIINPWLFYLVDCLEGLQIVFILVVIALAFAILMLTATISDLGWDEKEEMKSARRTRKIVIFFSILLLVAIPLIPSKDTYPFAKPVGLLPFKPIGLLPFKKVKKDYGDRKILSVMDFNDTHTTSIAIEME